MDVDRLKSLIAAIGVVAVIALGAVLMAVPPAARSQQVSPPGGRPGAYECEPVNPDATPEARALLKTLCDVSGKGIFTGQHNFPARGSEDYAKVAAITGRTPAIWGSDFGFTGGDDKDSVAHRDEMIAEAKRQAAAGAIIVLCWHMLRPTEDEPGQPGISWRESVQARLTDAQWEELITPDTPLHRRWEAYIDTAAVYLEELQEAHVAVLWRPMHENNGDFFWWGGRPGPAGTQELYRELYARLTYVHHLNNLIWVWNQNGPAPEGEFNDYFPGQQYVDVLSYDNYRSLDRVYYDELLALANGKPIALGEVGRPPSREVLEEQPKWTFFMTWGGMVNDAMKAAYNSPYFINRGDRIPVDSR